MKRWLFWATMAAVCIGMVSNADAGTRTVSHDPVSTYTDNTPIEATKTVSYSVYYQDTVTNVITQIANKVTITSHTFNDNTMVKGRLYNFYGQTWLSTGEFSANSPNYGWAVPLGQPKPMGGWVMTPAN